jgi:Flp pilus assembly protein TadD
MPPMQQSVEQLLDKARALQSRGDVKSAVRQYEEAMVLGGHHPVIAAELVAAQMASGRTQAAVKAARQAVHRHPGHAGARVLLAQVLAHLGDAKSALVELDAARRLDPRMAEIPA